MGSKFLFASRVGTYRASIINAYWLAERYPQEFHMFLGDLSYYLVFAQKCRIILIIIKYIITMKNI